MADSWGADGSGRKTGDRIGVEVHFSTPYEYQFSKIDLVGSKMVS